MILVEDRLRQLFYTIPPVKVNGKLYRPQFNFGTHKDLLKFLNQKTKEGGVIYPLIWLETPIVKEGNEKSPIVDIKLVLATLTNSEMSNLERLNVTFKTTLCPLYENVIKALKRSGFTTFIDMDRNKRTDYFNYGVNEEEHIATDIWDAIKLETTIKINDCPIKKINY